MADMSINNEGYIDSSDTTPIIPKKSSVSSSAEENRFTTNTEEHKYEEFATKLKVTCPTCQGKGKLSQGQADSLVALIPVRDKRLRPRKTKLYLGITIIIALLCIFLISFFLLPRSVSISIVNVESVKIFMPDDKDSVPLIDVAITFKLVNENFFDASVTSLSTDISWNKFLLVSTMETSPFSVSARKSVNATFTSRQIFNTKDLKMRVKTVCATGWNWQLFEKYVATATVSYLSRTEQISQTYYGYTSCHNSTSSFYP